MGPHRPSRLEWYRHRFGAMSAGEVLWRASRVLRAPLRRAAAQWPRPAALRLPGSGEPAARALAAASFASRLLLPDPGEARRRYEGIFPEGIALAREAGLAARSHRLELFARGAVSLGDRIDWHRDYLTGRRWPRRYAGAIDVRDGETIGEVRTVWELNRHHQFVVLAKAAFLTGDGRFAEEAARQWTDWVEQNPPHRGVNWTSPLEIAIRLLNWSWALAFLEAAGALDGAILIRWLASYQEQARAIASNLSRFSSANNHRIGEAAALAVSGTLFPWMRGAARMRDAGFRILEEEALLQIHEDGAGREQAPHYLAFAIDFYALAAAAAMRAGIAFPPSEVAKRLGLAAEFLASLRSPGGEFPAIGDSDEGRAAGLFAPGEGPYEPAIREAGYLGGNAAAAGSPPSEQAFWTLGGEAAAGGAQATAEAAGGTRAPAEAAGGAQATAEAAARGSRLFEKGGYAIFRHGRGPREVLGIFDAGELGYLSLAAHGHADALSLIISAGGRWLLADAGTYCYHHAWPWRRYFKGTGAHNTVLVDGKDQSEILGPSLLGRRARARMTRWVSSGGDYAFAGGEHDGYARGPAPVLHKRSVSFTPPGHFVVIDSLEGAGEHTIEARWHAGPGVSVTIGDEGAARFRAGPGASLWLYAARRPAGAAWTPSIVTGRESPPLGWMAPRFGARTPSPSVVYAGRMRLPVRFAWVIFAGEGIGEGGEPSLEAAERALSASDGAGEVPGPAGAGRGGGGANAMPGPAGEAGAERPAR